ncbi:MAG TPA: PIG-L family deacetylase [Vicinamibacterales bacterium]
MAIAAHPDDIEFLMAGTLRLLFEAGWETHYMTVANGSCGSTRLGPAAIARIRRAEAREGAAILGARFHESLTRDAEILYTLPLLRRVAAVVREVAPRILLVPSPQDYMEDHTETCRLAVSAAFVRGMPNFRTTPARPPVDRPVTIYHAMPHGLRTPLRQPIVPDVCVDTTDVHDVKRRALAAHRSQQPFLRATQGMNSYLQMMEDMSREVGRMSGRFTHAEGWRRHSHLGFCEPDDDPLAEALGNKVRSLERQAGRTRAARARS